ncbi:Arb2 domain-containing protein [Coniochaeta sp. 2T2.1]|nr:Arb2 domain-containing protein [Coniochaeta sp. 2T2.1]
MFRRRWSSLPCDPAFSSDLKQLGYFVNEIDEIRSIENPNNYFKYYITKNERWNERQRFAMNEAVGSLIHARLQKLGLVKTILPLGTPVDSPHVPIYVSSNLSTASRIVVIFPESAQDLGVIAHRVIGGPGGVTKGSMVSAIEAIQKGEAGDNAGIVLTNPGQLWWWPEGKRGLTPRDRFGISIQSAVHRGREYDARLNVIPGHETIGRHVKSVFEEVLGKMTRSDAKLAVVAVTDVADEVERYLDNEETWRKWEDRMECLALLSNLYGSTEPIKCEDFKRFLAERARTWIHDDEDLDIPLANPEGGLTKTGVGCPIFSAGPEPYIPELLMIHAPPAVFKFFREVGASEDFCNPRYEIYEAPPNRGDPHYWNGDDWKDEVGEAEAKALEEKKEVVAENPAVAEKIAPTESPKAEVKKRKTPLSADTSATAAEATAIPSIEHDEPSTSVSTSPTPTPAESSSTDTSSRPSARIPPPATPPTPPRTRSPTPMTHPPTSIAPPCASSAAPAPTSGSRTTIPLPACAPTPARTTGPSANGSGISSARLTSRLPRRSGRRPRYRSGRRGRRKRKRGRGSSLCGGRWRISLVGLRRRF